MREHIGGLLKIDLGGVIGRPNFIGLHFIELGTERFQCGHHDSPGV
jgi:hypothetical protein